MLYYICIDILQSFSATGKKSVGKLSNDKVNILFAESYGKFWSGDNGTVKVFPEGLKV